MQDSRNETQEMIWAREESELRTINSIGYLPCKYCGNEWDGKTPGKIFHSTVDDNGLHINSFDCPACKGTGKTPMPNGVEVFKQHLQEHIDSLAHVTSCNCHY